MSINVGSGIKINSYEVISRAVEEGIAYGYNRAHKHTDTPGENALKSQLHDSVMNELCEVINFGDD